jgi:hypothetical protein
MQTYTNKANTTRAAKKALAALGCPDPVAGTDFTIKELPSGKFAYELADTWVPQVEAPATKPQATLPTKDQIKAMDGFDKLVDTLDAKAMAQAAGTLATEAPAKPLGKRAAAAAALESAQQGVVPPVPPFNPSAQAANVKRAQQAHDLAVAGDVAGLEALAINGKAHSAELARRYRDLCLVAAKALVAQHSVAAQ